MAQSGNAQRVEAWARELLDHRMGGSVSSLPPELEDLCDLALAYGIQDALDRVLVAERGFEPIGYKIGATNAASRQRLNLAEPFFGRLYKQSTNDSPADFPRKPGFWQLAEAEIAIQLERDLGPSAAPYDAAQLADATGAILPAVEIAGTHWTPSAKPSVTALIADNGAHAHWIKGAPLRNFAKLDLLEEEVRLSTSANTAASGKGAMVDGGPFHAAAWLANALLRMGRFLKAGDYISTGSTTIPQPLFAGQKAVAQFKSLGTVAISIDIS